MPSAKYPWTGSPRSERLLRGIAGRDSTLYNWLKQDAWADKVFLFDDFLGDTINLDHYAVANTGGGGGTPEVDFAVPGTALAGGAIRGETGALNAQAVSIFGAPTWQGDKNCGLEMKLKLDTVGLVEWQVGFTQAAVAVATGVFDDIDTPTVVGGATDVAVVGVDTAQTYTQMRYVTEGSTAGMNPAATSLGVAPVADTYFTVRIQLIGNYSYCWVNGALKASHATTAESIEGGTLLGPYLYVRTIDPANVTKKMTVDYIALWQDR